MGCFPDSGGCERFRTDPFVSHLNNTEGSKFLHEACLDRLYRDSPQPEALYRDSITTKTMVVERKTIVWPLNHIAIHRNYHTVAEGLTNLLGAYAKDKSISVHISLPDQVNKGRLNNLPGLIASKILGGIYGPTTEPIGDEGDQSAIWHCREDKEERDASGEPMTGLIVRWEESDKFLPPTSPPATLVSEVRRHFQNTALKFEKYPDARGILLIDPHGSIRYADKMWWSSVFDVVAVPPAILEIWLATYDWITDVDQDWVFERVA